MGFKLVGVDIDGDHSGTHGCGDLHRVATHPTYANDHDEISPGHFGLGYGLIRCGQCIRDHCDVGQRQPGGFQSLLVNLTETVGGHIYMAGKTTLDVVSGHLLFATDRHLPPSAKIAVPTGNYRGDDDGTAQQALVVVSGGYDPTADLMPEG